MLATKKQIEYLLYLTNRAVFIKARHPWLVPDGIYPTTWGMDMTSEKASARITYFNAILTRANEILYPNKKVSKTEDLPA